MSIVCDLGLLSLTNIDYASNAEHYWGKLDLLSVHEVSSCTAHQALMPPLRRDCRNNMLTAMWLRCCGTAAWQANSQFTLRL
jgi:hypothetical protein